MEVIILALVIVILSFMLINLIYDFLQLKEKDKILEEWKKTLLNKKKEE